MMVRPTNVQWKLVGYNEAREQLQWSQFIPTHATTAKNGTELAVESETPAIDDSSYHALKLQFDLPSGCYATVALRELLHCEMDKESQKSNSDPNPNLVPCPVIDSNPVEG